MDSFDLIVIGGGCNGTGIARDAALRGLKVLLLEKNDFASGTTGASSGMIHGGPRYLMHEVGITKMACHDAGHILKIAPHLVFRIPFLVPVLKKDDPSLVAKIRLELVETFFELYDHYSPLKGGKIHTRLSTEEVKQLEPSLDPDVIGAITFDEWGIDTHRLCVANALAAKENGAVVFNHTEVLSLLKEGKSIVGVLAKQFVTGEEKEYYGKIVFNATGPWAPRLAGMAGVSVKLRPAKGIHLIFDRRLTNMAIVAKCIDGRQIFINPHENTTLLGTTDDDYYGDLDNIPVTEDEIEYLLQAIETVYPEIRKARILSTWRGVRPTLYQDDRYEDNLSREHEVFDHEKNERVSGFLSMAGGKLSSYREMAEEATDLVCKKLKVIAVCQTHLVPLPGGESLPDPHALAQKFKLDPYAARRLVYRQGQKAEEILEKAKPDPEGAQILCPCEPVMKMEVRHVVQEEWAFTLSDICRRTRLGQGPCQGALCLVPAVSCLREERSLTMTQVVDELKETLEQGWRGRRVILKGTQLAQEEINQTIYKGVLRVSEWGGDQ
ncbi:MAG: glycerol-3-phosphate dehydrogenase/oxidase [Deltaproteobacteria bacterium]|nr:glycerol-3-phosphate dehydrogenase/oxidase [Deltaproteobacteria bacterium]